MAAGWRTALLHAGLVFLVMMGLGAALAVLQYAIDPQALSAIEVPRAGALIFSFFHRIPIEVDLPPLQLGSDAPFSGPVDLDITIVFPLMLGTFLACWLLYRSGRAVAMAAGGTGWIRAFHGLKVALPYSVLSLLVSFLARVPGDTAGLTGGAQGQAVIHPSAGGALLWPLLLGGLFAGAGALATVREDLFVGERGRWVRGVLSGGWRMAWIAVLLGTVGFLVVAAVNPDATRAYFDFATERGPEAGALTILATILFLPNVGTAAAAAAMGGSANLQFLGASCPVVSYARFPAGTAAVPGSEITPFADPCASLPIEFDLAPVAYFLFVLVPLAATVLGGRWAAERGRAASRKEGAALGAAAGVPFALLFLGLMFLSRVSYEAAPLAVFGAGEFVAGPGLLSGFLLAIVWGAGGGAIGGLLGSAPASEEPNGPAPAVERSTSGR